MVRCICTVNKCDWSGFYVSQAYFFLSVSGIRQTRQAQWFVHLMVPVPYLLLSVDCPQRHPEDTANTVAHPYNHRKTLQPVAIIVSARPPHMRN